MASDYEMIRDAHAAMLKRFTQQMAKAMQTFDLDGAKLAPRDAIAGLRLIADQLPLLDDGQAPSKPAIDRENEKLALAANERAGFISPADVLKQRIRLVRGA